ncbi:MAG: rRNA (cytosine967-C5)-methyltransferase [Thermosediminibacterales bacterium]|nr:rRNA (cytosine967-C5)-methyltransferase [Thermosediminibacterales bacterium]MDK2835431.1 rRNA (cytosine967-C5)-methyltransferase [Thermosediminibacterales bacterium]
MNKTPREIALEILYSINEKGAFSNIALKKAINKFEIRGIDKAFITELVYGCIERKMTLDWVIEKFSNIRVDKMNKYIRNILRMGVYQIVFLDKVPISAACNESVNLAKKYGPMKLTGFVNGVLRNIARNIDELEFPSLKTDPIEHISIKYSFPKWMIKKWIKLYGVDFTLALCKFTNKRPEFSIRVNTIKTTKDDLKLLFEKQGFEVSDGKYVKEALRIKGVKPVEELESYHKGFFQPQDEGSMMVSHVLNPQPGDLIVDVCAGPGGKTTHIAQLMNNKGCIISRDVYEHKLILIRNLCKRLGIDIVKTELKDATIEDESLREKADRVLVDVPCMGFGVIRRKPDIKWTKDEHQIKEMVKLQKKILEISSKYVKKNGILLYTTCSIGPEENEEVVKGFLNKHRDFTLRNLKPFFEKKFNFSQPTAWQQLFPHIHGVDGFFMACMEKL